MVAGATIEEVEDAFDGHDGFDWGNHIMNFGVLLVPELYSEHFDPRAVDDLMIGADTFMVNAGAAASDAWMDFITELHKNN